MNLDPDAAPLAAYLEGVPADAAWAQLDDFRCAVTTHTPVPCNWKVVADGFSETYHVQGIHREMLGSIDDIHATQRIWDLQSVSYQDYGVPSPRLGRDVDDQTVWDSFVITQGGRMGAGVRATVPDADVPTRPARSVTSSPICCATSTNAATASTARHSTPIRCCGSRSTTCSRTRPCSCGARW